MPQHDLEATAGSGAGSEWLFRSEGQVFGPVPESKLVELLYDGRVGAATEVAREAGRWQPLGEIPGFVLHVKKAEARARVHAEVQARESAARRRRAMRGAGVALAAVALLLLVAGGAWYLATRRPWERDSSLLADFGGGISVGDVRVGGEARGGDGEVALPDAPAGARSVTAAPARSRRTAAAPTAAGAPSATAPSAATRSRSVSGSAEGGDLVMAQYDPRLIKEVVARRQGSLAPCLREEARRSPEFRGEIPMEFAVGNDGRVAQLWIHDPRFRSGELRDCVARTLREWQFQPFPGERPVVSLAFRIGD